jgi:hypothetical protein
MDEWIRSKKCIEEEYESDVINEAEDNMDNYLDGNGYVFEARKWNNQDTIYCKCW